MSVDFPAIAVAPFYGSKPNKEFRVLSATFGDGYSQRVLDGLNTTLESWDMEWSVLTLDEKDVIVNFLDARAGYESFNYTMPGDSVSKKWICKKYVAAPKAYNVYSLTATFERVYDL